MTIGPPPESGHYPFSQLDEAKREAADAGIDLIDFGMGDPRDETPEFIRAALAEAIRPTSSYPRAAGLPELRQAISDWLKRRFDADVDPQSAIMPTLGAKEIIHSLPAYTISPKRNLVLVPSPAYPVYERGARFHGAEVAELPLLSENSFLPDFSAISDATWARTALVWVNYPNNPTGACAPIEFYARASELARRHDFVLASDEAYTELYFDSPPVSALQLADHRNLLVVNTLSKRSCMTGYRSGFISGDPFLITAMTKYRPSVGVTPQEFIQRASAAAWQDEQHVAEFRSRWATKRQIVLEALMDAEVEVRSEATFFLWIRHHAGESSANLAARLMRAGIVVTPGSFFGSTGEGFVRLALVPTIEDCTRAAERLSTFSWNARFDHD